MVMFHGSLYVDQRLALCITINHNNNHNSNNNNHNYNPYPYLYIYTIMDYQRRFHHSIYGHPKKKLDPRSPRPPRSPRGSQRFGFGAPDEAQGLGARRRQTKTRLVWQGRSWIIRIGKWHFIVSCPVKNGDFMVISWWFYGYLIDFYGFLWWFHGIF